jgi:hypothetical protein
MASNSNDQVYVDNLQDVADVSILRFKLLQLALNNANNLNIHGFHDVRAAADNWEKYIKNGGAY